MTSKRFSRTALAVAVMVALSGAHAAATLRTVAPHVTTPDQLTDTLAANSNLLLLRSGVIDPVAERIDLSSLGAGADVVTSRYAIVQFADNPAKSRARLEQLGVQFLGYVPNNAYQVRLEGTTLRDLQADAAVRWVGVYQPGMKLDPALWSAARKDLKQAPQGGLEIDVFGFGPESAETLATTIAKIAGASVLSIANDGDVPSVRVHVEESALANLIVEATREDVVAWVAPHYQEYVNNTGGIGSMQGDSPTTGTAGSGALEAGRQPIWDHGIYGTGQIISISDSGLDANEAWFTTLNKGAGDHTEITFADAVAAVPPALGSVYPNNKVYAYWVQPGATAYDNNTTCPGGNPTSYHGTHTSGTIAGDAGGTVGATTYTASTPTSHGHELADGMAPNAQLMFQDIGNDTTGCLSITNLGGTLAQAYAGGARIHSASWGAATSGVYSGNDRVVDNSLSRQEDMIFVVSAGNSGSNATTIGSPGNAKNAITVGALGHAGSKVIAGFSSRGPTVDGRLKPDIMAPGSSTISAAGDVNTTATIEAPVSSAKSGTSMAAPTISGNAALMRQFFTDGFYPRGSKTSRDTLNPSGMVMKAVILNGTNPVLGNNTTPTNQFFNNNYGWGRMWLDSNLWFDTTPSSAGTDTRRLRVFERTNSAGLQTGDSHEYSIANVAAGEELRATLTWYDPEGSSGAALSLVNNLDLEVVGPDSTVYYGNVFTAGVSTTGGNRDIRNTVEQFRMTAPAAGAYTFRVKGTAVPGSIRPNTNRQGYGLAVSGAFGLPDTAPFSAPTGLVATAAANGTSVSFASAPGAQGFQLYRAAGSCATAAAGDFRLVATGNASPVVDTAGQGGLQYAYKVRGISNDVEGEASTCIDATSVSACTLQPDFDATSLRGGASLDSTCRIPLTWSPATPSCASASSVSYSVLRSSDPYFATSTVLDNNVSSPSFTDFAVTQGTPYYYKVLATDNTGNAAPISNTVGGTAIGPGGVDGESYLDDADTHVYVTLDSPWQVTNTAATNGILSYHSGADGANYTAGACASMTSPSIFVQDGASLTFKMKYNIESGWDILVLEISTDGGATWNDLPPTGGYPSAGTLTSAGNACGFPVGKTGFGGSTSATPGNETALAVFQPFTANLAAYAGQSIKVRWRLSTDGGYELGGAYVDEISLGGTVLDRLFKNGFEEAPSFNCSVVK